MGETLGEESPMKKCNSENSIDDYLLDRLDETQKEKFEEHYFNCPECFEKMVQRNEMIAVIKTSGSEIFRNIYTRQKSSRSKLETILAFFTPRQWAVAVISATLVLVVAIGVIPNLKTAVPEFFVNDDLVRGSSIALISPVIDNLDRVPSEFRWERLGDNIQYKLFINHEKELLWSTTTENNFVILSEGTKSMMKPSEKYSWQVKAFSPEGTLMAVSSRVHFNFLATK
jgi:hypothetical protein